MNELNEATYLLKNCECFCESEDRRYALVHTEEGRHCVTEGVKRGAKEVGEAREAFHDLVHERETVPNETTLEVHSSDSHPRPHERGRRAVPE